MPPEDAVPAAQRPLARYRSYLTADSVLVVHDVEVPDAWLASDTFVVLSSLPKPLDDEPSTGPDTRDGAPGPR